MSTNFLIIISDVGDSLPEAKQKNIETIMEAKITWVI